MEIRINNHSWIDYYKDERGDVKLGFNDGNGNYFEITIKKKHFWALIKDYFKI